MTDLLSTAVSGLRAFQRALDVTSQNIANAATDGYSRQRVELATRQAQAYGNGYVGTGVNVVSVRRVYDDFLVAQLRGSSSSHARLDAFAAAAERVDNLLGDSGTGLSATLQNLAQAFQGVANSPASTPARQSLLSQAGVFVQRMQGYDSRLRAMDAELNARIETGTVAINTLGEGIARLNAEIEEAYGRMGQPPNDLLDQRDRLIDELATHVDVSTVAQGNGVVNVFIGTGQPLVVGSTASQLVTSADPFDAARRGVALRTPSGPADITSQITGGTLGGLLDFRREMLDPVRDELGRITVAVTDLLNTEHGKGMDLRGALGGELFATGDAVALPARANTGSAAITVTRSDAGALTGGNYILEYTTGGWALRDAASGVTKPLAGSGTALDPYRADGLSIVVSGGAAAVGDRFQLQPTRGAIDGLGVLITDPSQIAAAVPVATSAAAANRGDASIGAPAVLDPSNPQLGSAVTIEFLTPTTYSINGAGSYAYVSGTDIDVNGWRVQISGSPLAGDRFDVTANTAGVGDNGNMRSLIASLDGPALNGGTTSVNGAIGSLVARIGIETQQAQVNRDAQDVIRTQDRAAVDSVSGVNLDEEAANMLRMQQAYMAAAQLIATASAVFESLLAATRR